MGSLPDKVDKTPVNYRSGRLRSRDLHQGITHPRDSSTVTAVTSVHHSASNVDRSVVKFPKVYSSLTPFKMEESTYFNTDAPFDFEEPYHGASYSTQGGLGAPTQQDTNVLRRINDERVSTLL